MRSARMRRVNEALREVLSARIAEGLEDPRIGFVTVTAVDTTSDFSYARVYVSVFGSDAERDATLEGLRSSRGYLQQGIARELRIKRTPQLEFLHDEALARGERISRLLDDPDGEARGS
jgi:ribosome-binding factor A